MVGELHSPAGMKLRALAPATLVLLAACTLAIPVTYVWDVALQGPAGGGSVEVPVDLSTNASAWDHRSDVTRFSVDGVTATVHSIGATNQATHLQFQVRFRPEGAPADGSQDVTVADVPALPVVEGAVATAAGTAAVDQLLLDALKGSGRFTLVAAGTADAAVDAHVDVQVHGQVAYEVAKQ